MRGYLLDTNHVVKMHERHPLVLARIASLPPSTQIRASVVTLAEIDWGHAVTKTTDQAKRDAYTRFVNTTFLPNALPVSSATRIEYVRIEYVRILSEIWKRHPPPKGKKTERHLIDLGVDVNDVWIAATACEHGLILATTDNMACIREVLPTSLQPENWLAASPPSTPPLP